MRRAIEYEVSACHLSRYQETDKVIRKLLQLHKMCEYKFFTSKRFVNTKSSLQSFMPTNHDPSFFRLLTFFFFPTIQAALGRRIAHLCILSRIYPQLCLLQLSAETSQPTQQIISNYTLS